MKCNQCGYELEDGNTLCPGCGTEQGQIEVLPPEERENFQGLTLSGPTGEEPRYESYHEYRGANGGRVYVRHFTLGSKPGGMIQKLIIGAVLLGLVIIALPLALIALGVLLAGWWWSWLRRR